MKRKFISILLICLLIFVITSCNLTKNLSIEKFTLSNENKIFYELGIAEIDRSKNISNPCFYKFLNKNNKDVSITLFKANSNLQGWSKVNSIETNINYIDILSISFNKDSKPIIKINTVSKENLSGIDWELETKISPQSYTLETLLDSQKMEITNSDKIIFSVLMTDTESIVTRNIINTDEDGDKSKPELERIKPTDINHFIVTIKEN